MEAKELMIGDWVECVDSTHKNKVYAKVVNYPYSKLIGYNGIRSIDIIKKIIAT